MRGVRALAAALVLVVGGQAPASAQETACATCTAGEIQCPSCAGSGTQTIDCTLCGGTGQSDCLACRGEPKKGWLVCPNRVCHDGQTRWQGGDEDPCKLCKKSGKIRCALCRETGTRACALCVK